MMESDLPKENFKQFQERIKSEYGPQYFDRQGKPLELLEWCRLCEDLNYKIIQQDYIGNYMCSTVWIGMNMSFFKKHPILIFETMIFNESNKDDSLHLYQDRYGTEKEALIGHKIAIALCKGAITLEELNKKYEDECELLQE